MIYNRSLAFDFSFRIFDIALLSFELVWYSSSEIGLLRHETSTHLIFFVLITAYNTPNAFTYYVPITSYILLDTGILSGLCQIKQNLDACLGRPQQ